MSISISAPQNQPEVLTTPRIAVIGVGGAGGNAVNNMIQMQLPGVSFIIANTDAQALQMAQTDQKIQMGRHTTGCLGSGAKPEVGRAAAEEVIDEITEHLKGMNMTFITAGMGGGTGTGAAPVIARVAKELGVLTVGVVTKPFNFEGTPRMRVAQAGIEELEKYVDTLLIVPNQNLFLLAGEKLTMVDAFKKVDNVLYSGVKSITDLIIRPGLINLDFADVRTAMQDMGRAMMGSGEAKGEGRALKAAEIAVSNPLLDNICMANAKSILINISGHDIDLVEVQEAADFVREQANQDTNIIFGAGYDETLEGAIRISVVATGIGKPDAPAAAASPLRSVSKPEARTIPPHRETSSPMEEENASKAREEPQKQGPSFYTFNAPAASASEERREEALDGGVLPEAPPMKDAPEKDAPLFPSMPEAPALFSSLKQEDPDQPILPFHHAGTPRAARVEPAAPALKQAASASEDDSVQVQFLDMKKKTSSIIDKVPGISLIRGGAGKDAPAAAGGAAPKNRLSLDGLPERPVTSFDSPESSPKAAGKIPSFLEEEIPTFLKR